MDRRVVVVTGCSSGLGKALCEELHVQTNMKGDKLFTVVATARKLPSITPLKELGMHVEALDVTKPESIDTAVANIIAKFGTIDVLINNAGVLKIGPLVEQSMSDIKSLYETNVFGVLQLTQAVAPIMMRKRSGLIVNVGSVSANLVTPFGGLYSSSKAALHSLSTALQMELSPFNVQVMVVVAGSIKSELSSNAVASDDQDRYDNPESMYRKIADKIRLRAFMAQKDPKIKTAEETAAQVVGVIKQSSPPFWLKAAGNVWYYVLCGFVQSWVWTAGIGRILINKFGLSELP